MKRLLNDLWEEVSNPTTIYCDNLNNIQLAKNPIFHARTKHIKVHYHFVREQFLSGALGLRQFSGALRLCHLDVPNMRGRRVSRDQAREQTRSGRDHDTESDDEFGFGSAERSLGWILG